jgi:hypothetical protein
MPHYVYLPSSHLFAELSIGWAVSCQTIKELPSKNCRQRTAVKELPLKNCRQRTAVKELSANHYY